MNAPARTLTISFGSSSRHIRRKTLTRTIRKLQPLSQFRAVSSGDDFGIRRVRLRGYISRESLGASIDRRRRPLIAWNSFSDHAEMTDCGNHTFGHREFHDCLAFWELLAGCEFKSRFMREMGQGSHSSKWNADFLYWIPCLSLTRDIELWRVLEGMRRLIRRFVPIYPLSALRKRLLVPESVFQYQTLTNISQFVEASIFRSSCYDTVMPISIENSL